MRTWGFMWVVLGLSGWAQQAAVTVRPTVVQASADAGAAPTALLAPGTPLVVTDCVPSCDAGEGWAMIDDRGVVKLSALRWTQELVPPPAPEGFLWGRAANPDAGVSVRRRPSLDAGVLTLEPAHKTLAFLVDQALAQRGWLQRTTAGFVRRSEVELQGELSPTLRGEMRPRLPLAFVIRPTTRPGAQASDSVEKYARFEVLSRNADGGVLTPTGVLPPRSVRIASLRAPPPGVPPGAQWLDVALSEQTLVAYEGETPVFATLISSGTTGVRATHLGLFQVYLKSRHDRMHGRDYFVEEVPFIQFYDRGQGLHAAPWHNRFGQPMSHGCVNLSSPDAQWLFEWGRPAMPPGWHTVWPLQRGTDSLWVYVER